MIQEFVDRFMEHKAELRHVFEGGNPTYQSIVEEVVKILDDDGYECPDWERIHVIDDGEWQGTLLFIIGSKDYQPSVYWSVDVDYGSCSYCDTLEAIGDWESGEADEQQLDDCMTLALHIVQRMKIIYE